MLKTNLSEGSATITLSGRFDFNMNKAFRDAYESLLESNEVKTLDLNFSKVEYMDSSALGMLLVLREKANEANKQVRLLNCKGVIRQVLDVAHFDRFFKIV